MEERPVPPFNCPFLLVGMLLSEAALLHGTRTAILSLALVGEAGWSRLSGLSGGVAWEHLEVGMISATVSCTHSTIFAVGLVEDEVAAAMLEREETGIPVSTYTVRAE